MRRRDLFKILFGTSLVPQLQFASETSSCNPFAHWWCELNGWEWPKDWGQPPERFRHKLKDLPFASRKMYECHKDEYAHIMNVLERLAGGNKEVLRYANVHLHKRMTNAEFEDWWPTSRPSDKES
jgi:hypothetical protein